MMQKSLAQNALFNMLYKALTVIFPLVTVSYVSHILGASGIGQVSSAQNFVTYFTMVASLGIPTYGVRAIAKKRIHNNKKLTDEVFSELFIINACATTISLISYIIIAAFWINCTELNIIFSSLINDQMRAKGEALGADVQLSKPEIGLLVNEIDKLLR